MTMQFIPLQELKGRNKNAVIKFLVQHEDFCTQLSSLLRRNISNCYVVYVNDIKPEEIYGIISIKKTILFLLPFVNSETETALQLDFAASFKKFYLENKFDKPVCLNGEKKGITLLLKIFAEMEINPDQINEYSLMKLESKQFLRKLKTTILSRKDDLQVIRCKKDMPEKLKSQLIQLQTEYEIEEVVPDCFEFDEASCRLRFANALRTHYVLALKTPDEKLVAKAGTNATGFKTVQIGGVYTQKEFRGKHCATRLMETLLFRIIKMHRAAVLFVKVENQGANILYNSLGFKKIGSYSIAYFT